jgi:hypothetical protein
MSVNRYAPLGYGRRCRLALCALLLLASFRPAAALNVTGVLLQALDGNGNPTDVVWHTSSDPAARPLGFTRAQPRLARTFPLGNDEQGEVDRWFPPGIYIVTLFWQYRLGEFPPAMVLNVYFNGDSLTPGISAMIPAGLGMTQVRVNPAPTTLSLYLRDVANPNTLVYDNGSERAQLGAAFYMNGAGPNGNFWQLSDFMDIDRVGLTGFTRDGAPDGVLVFELTVGPSQNPNITPGVSSPAQTPSFVGPLSAVVGEDELGVVPTPTLAVPSPAPVPEDFTSLPAETPTVAGTQPAATLTAAASAGVAGTPSPASPVVTPTPGSNPTSRPLTVTPAAPTPAITGAAGSPTPAQTKARPHRK